MKATRVGDVFSKAYERAMNVQTQHEADALFESMLVHAEMNGLPRAQYAEVLRSNLAYYAGYFDDETRERVERLFECAHPVFGKWKDKGTPTPEDAFRLGIELGRSHRNRNT